MLYSRVGSWPYPQILHSVGKAFQAQTLSLLSFRISVTFEMRTTEYGEICISIVIETVAEQAFKQNGKMGKESKVAERQRESVCVCKC